MGVSEIGLNRYHCHGCHGSWKKNEHRYHELMKNSRVPYPTNLYISQPERHWGETQINIYHLQILDIGPGGAVRSMYWNIYLHLLRNWRSFVGKSSSTMEIWVIKSATRCLKKALHHAIVRRPLQRLQIASAFFDTVL